MTSERSRKVGAVCSGSDSVFSFLRKNRKVLEMLVQVQVKSLSFNRQVGQHACRRLRRLVQASISGKPGGRSRAGLSVQKRIRFRSNLCFGSPFLVSFKEH